MKAVEPRECGSPFRLEERWWPELLQTARAISQFPYVLPGKYQLELLPGQFSVPYYLSVTEVTLKAREEKMLEVAAEKEEKPIEQLFRTPQWQIFEIE